MSNAPKFREEAIPLVSFDPTSNDFALNPEAVALISQIPAPISVVGVAGLYRTGKSYLLNRVLLDRSSGFGVGATTNACTKGIWMWAKPLKGHTPSGEISNVIVIDSEGLGAVDQDNNHDCRIFALVLLISSMFLYNSTGTIDENAINNLSLVVNITKHIHVKSGGEGEAAGEDYAKYFPSFLWILRDFALQLINKEGEDISSSEYLEKALAQQTGFTDEIENKNRIRRLIQQFFPDRDCCTLVRPVTNEEGLQNLADRPLEDLRPEFVEQVLLLRKTIFNQVKPKALNGNYLSGEMLAGIVDNYVHSINTGAVPNIESAWTYICQDHCQKTFEESLRHYEDRLSDRMLDNFPTSEEYLQSVHEELIEESLKRFRKGAMGEDAEKFGEELASKLKDRFLGLREENRREFERLLKDSMEEYFEEVDNRVKSGEVRTYSEFDKELKGLRSYFMDLEPQGPGKAAMVHQFLFHKSSDAAHFLIKNQRADLESKMGVLESSKKTLEDRLYQSEEQLNKEKNDLSMKILELESRKNDMGTKNEMLNARIQEMREERESLEDELCSRMEKQKEEARGLEGNLKKQLQELEEAKREVERGQIMENSKHDQEMALLQQKISYFESGSTTSEKREEALRRELSEARKQAQEEVADVKKSYQDKLEGVEKELFSTRETLNEVQNEIERKDEANISMVKDIEDQNKTFQNILEEKEAKLKDFEVKVLDLERSPYQLESLKRRLEEENLRLKDKLQKADDRVKEFQDKYMALQASAKKEQALLEQSLSFHQIQVEDLQKQLRETTRFNADAINSIEGFTGGKKDLTEELEEENNQLKKKLESALAEKSKNKEFSEGRISQLSERLEELEEELSRNGEKWTSERKDLQLEAEKLRDDCSRFKSQLQESGMQADKKVEALTERYSTKILELETELETVKDKDSKDLRNIQEKGEESLNQLKTFFEEEKARLAKKLAEEKGKHSKSAKILEEEYQARLKHERHMHEEQVDSLQQEVKEFEIQQLANGQRFKQEMVTKQQRIEHLEEGLEETKKQLDKIQESSATGMKQTMANFENERRAFVSKIEAQNQELSKKNIELFQLKQQIENSASSKDRELKDALARAKQNLQDKETAQTTADSIRSKLQTLTDEWLEKENTKNKEIALSNQKNEFYMKRITELSSQLENQTKDADSKMAAKREEIAAEMEAAIGRIQNEKNMMEQRYEAKKRQVKELEGDYSSKVASMEKTIAVQQEKISAIETKKFELEKRLESESGLVREEIKRERELFDAERKALEKEIETLKVKQYDTELQLVESQANYDKDQALWESKNKFLEKSKAQLKDELSEQQKNFDILVQKFNQFRVAEKEENQSSQSAFVQRIEQRYLNQIEDLKDQQRLRVAEAEDKIRRLEKENKKYTEQLMEVEQNKLGSHALLEKRVRESMQAEKQLQEELLAAKRGHEDRIMLTQRRNDEEREKVRMKVFQIESQLKESENRRQMLIYEHEKEKTRWNIENGQLAAQQNDYLEQIDKLQRKVDSMQRENEQLMNDVRQAKRNSTSNSLAALANKKDMFFERSGYFRRGDSGIEDRAGRVSQDRSGDFGGDNNNFFGSSFNQE